MHAGLLASSFSLRASPPTHCLFVRTFCFPTDPPSSVIPLPILCKLVCITAALQTCITTHGDICTQSRSHLLQPKATESPPFSSTDALTVLNFDTLQVEIPLGHAFLALSYALGRRPDTAPWEHTEGNGTIGIRSDQLPPTLADAIALCLDLGQRCLWVYQICIDQKDSAALTSLIHIMDRVYALALATIIVAFNECADERIACRSELPHDLGSKLRQDGLQRSCWSKRA